MACEAMGQDKRASHRCYQDPQDCVLCMAWFGSTHGITLDTHHCTRYTTDLTSVGELEKALMLERYKRIIGCAPHLNDRDADVVGIIVANQPSFVQVFTGKPLEVNWCAAILWAATHATEGSS